MTKYILDTCALTWAMRDAYPMDIAPVFWTSLVAAVEDAIVLSNVMVKYEIERQDDDLFKWTKGVSGLFVPMTQDLLDEAARVVRAHPTMINARKDKDGADPFLIAQAKLAGAILVTQETPNGPTHKRKKIPDVCALEGIQTLKMLDLVRVLKWKIS